MKKSDTNVEEENLLLRQDSIQEKYRVYLSMKFKLLQKF